MKLPLYLLFFLTALAVYPVVAQQPMASLDILAYHYSLHVTPDEQLIITTTDGEVFIADSLTGHWRTNHSSDENFFIWRSNFFTANTGIALISRGDFVICRTIDGGKSWVAVGPEGVANATWNLDNGKVWMSLRDKGIAYSPDYGLTWEQLPFPTAKEDNYPTLYFNTKQEGIIGSEENQLGYTADNCRHWRALSTPLDQGVYTKTNLRDSPSINNVAIFHDYFLVTQEDMVFYTRRDAIRWRPLPGYTNFHTDANADVLYLVRKNNQVVRAGNHFEVVYQYPVARPAEKWICRNGSLFATNGREITQYKRDNTVRSAGMISDMPAKPKSYLFHNGPTLFLYVRGNTIYSSDAVGDTTYIPWQPTLTLPFRVKDPDKLSYLEHHAPEELVYQPSPDSLFYYDMRTKAFEITSLSAMFGELTTNGITSITFQYHEDNDYNDYSDGKTYTLQGDRYVVEEQSLKNANLHPRLLRGPREIDTAAVHALLHRVIHPNYQRPTGADLPFTAADFTQCRKDILSYKQFVARKQHKEDETRPVFQFHKNNIDFDRLIALVDSIPTVDSLTLGTVMWDHSFEFYSDSRKTITITLKDSQNNMLEITQEYSGQNSLCLTWFLEIRGVSTTSVDADINRFIQTYCPSLLPKPNDVNFLHTLVKTMYR